MTRHREPEYAVYGLIAVTGYMVWRLGNSLTAIIDTLGPARFVKRLVPGAGQPFDYLMLFDTIAVIFAVTSIVVVLYNRYEEDDKK